MAQQTRRRPAALLAAIGAAGVLALAGPTAMAVPGQEDDGRCTDPSCMTSAPSQPEEQDNQPDQDGPVSPNDDSEDEDQGQDEQRPGGFQGGDPGQSQHPGWQGSDNAPGPENDDQGDQSDHSGDQGQGGHAGQEGQDGQYPRHDNSDEHESGQHPGQPSGGRDDSEDQGGHHGGDQPGTQPGHDQDDDGQDNQPGTIPGHGSGGPDDDPQDDDHGHGSGGHGDNHDGDDGDDHHGGWQPGGDYDHHPDRPQPGGDGGELCPPGDDDEYHEGGDRDKPSIPVVVVNVNVVINNVQTIVNNVFVVKEIPPRNVVVNNKPVTQYVTIIKGVWYDGHWANGQFVPTAVYPKAVQSVEVAKTTPQEAKGLPVAEYRTGTDPVLTAASDPWYENYRVWVPLAGVALIGSGVWLIIRRRNDDGPDVPPAGI